MLVGRVILSMLFCKFIMPMWTNSKVSNYKPIFLVCQSIPCNVMLYQITAAANKRQSQLSTYITSDQVL